MHTFLERSEFQPIIYYIIWYTVNIQNKLIFIESVLHARTTNKKGKSVIGIYSAIPGCYKNVGRGL